MELTEISRALEVVYARYPHLPRPDGLAGRLLAAHDTGGLLGIVGACWSLGHPHGARRGRAIVVGALRYQLARALTTPELDEQGQWLVEGMARAADQLRPQPVDIGLASAVLGVNGRPRDLDEAVHQFAQAWRAGHGQAADNSLEEFAARAVALLGADRLATTPLTPDLFAYELLDEVMFSAYRIADHDRDHPTTPTPPDLGEAGRAERPFPQLGQVEPSRRPTRFRPPRRGGHPGRPGPRR